KKWRRACNDQIGGFRGKALIQTTWKSLIRKRVTLKEGAGEQGPRDNGYPRCMLPQTLRPIRLSRRIEPFDSDQFIFELKVDGFRALAHIEGGRCELISRNGNTFRGFTGLATWIPEHLR